jgi:membrane protease subunit HflC
VIRFAFFTMVVVCAAAGIGWLGEAGYPPLVVVHEGEQVIVSGPGDREQVFESAGGFGFRVPLLSRAEVFDTRLRVSEVKGVPVKGGEDALTLQLWWRISDALRYAGAWPDAASAERAVAALLVDPFSRALANTELAQTLVAGAAPVESLLEAVAAAALKERGITLAGLRVAARHGEGLVAAMRSAREEEVAALRRDATEFGPRLRAEARRNAAQIESGALREAEITRGHAEAEAARIYADAHSEAPEFYAFSRRLEAYRNTLGPGTTLVLSPDHEFFRLLSPSGEPGP